MVENALRWPMVAGTYLEVIGCLRAALMGLLGGEMDFNTGMVLEWFLSLG